MAIAIRGTTPLVVATGSNPISGTLTGTRQPQAGDLLVIFHGNDYYALSNMPTPTVGGSTSGVNAVSGGTADGGSFFAHAKAYTYAVGSTGDLTVSVTETGSGDEEKVLVVYVLSGADTSTPVDGTAANNSDSTGSTTSRVCNAVSPSSASAFLICHTNDGNGSNSVSYTPPSGMTEQYDGSLASSMGYSGATLQLSASGSTGTKTFTASGNASYCTLTVAIKTAAGGGSTVNGTATLTGAGGLTAGVRQQATAAATGAGSLSAVVAQRATGVLTGSATLSAAVTQRAGSSPSGAGTLTPLAVQRVGAILSAAGTLATAATIAAPASLTGAGSLTAGSGSVVTGTATIVATSALAAVSRQAVGATLAGAATLTATAVQAATASLAGTAGLTATVGAGRITPRPDTGTTTRPNAGITARPDSGVTPRP